MLDLNKDENGQDMIDRGISKMLPKKKLGSQEAIDQILNS